MSNEYTTFQQNVEKAFAPVTDAFKSYQGKLEVPQAARDFVKRSVELAKENAGNIQASVAKATDALENSAGKTVAGIARYNRDLQAAAYDDANAFFNTVTKIADAKSFGEAAQLQVDYLRERADVNVGRAKSLVDFVTGSLADGAKKAQENISKVATFNKAA